MMERPERLALIIGAMKSGTTSLFDLLATHPEVAGSRYKEPEYFSKSGVSSTEREHDRPYLDLWQHWDPSRHRLALEASTAYTMPHAQSPADGVARFAERWGADVRLVYIMRHPVERVASHFRHSASHVPERFARDRAGVLQGAIRISSYATQLGPWVERFGRDRILLLSFEELQRSGPELLQRTCTFLGIDPGHTFVRVAEPSNVSWPVLLTKLARSPRFGAIWQPLPAPLRKALKNLARKATGRFLVKLTAAERREATERLRPEVARLASEYGFDPGWDMRSAET